MIIYVDFFSIMPQGNSKFHGGGNYARNVIREIMKRKTDEIELVVLCPYNYRASEESEPLLAQYKDIKWKNVKAVDENFLFEDGAVLFSPILYRDADFKNLIKIKKKNKNLKVCATIHDLRTLDYYKDNTEKYYYSGIRRVLFPIYKFVFEYLLIQMIKKPHIRKCLGYLDEIYTVSNYAMQDIIKINPKANVSWYYQGTVFENIISNNDAEAENYILFVSGNRRLKNLSHALIGFVKYKKENKKNDMKLVITGVDDDVFQNLCKIPGIDENIINSYVKHYDYVSNEKLANLYSNCQFVLYTSKMEGFGLPVLEAARYGKVCIASNRTAIPEVLGAAVLYVSPNDDNGIARAIAYLSNEVNLKNYENRIATAVKIAQRRSVIDMQCFIEDLMNHPAKE